MEASISSFTSNEIECDVGRNIATSNSREEVYREKWERELTTTYYVSICIVQFTLW
jgi:hypothetical protein